MSWQSVPPTRYTTHFMMRLSKTDDCLRHCIRAMFTDVSVTGWSECMSSMNRVHRQEGRSL